MTNVRTAALALAAFAAMTTAAAAESPRQRAIDRAQAAQERDIAAHRYVGDLTIRERRALEAEQMAIRRMEAEAQADGRITRREFAEIRDAQARARTHIEQESSDGQVSLWRRILSRKGF